MMRKLQTIIILILLVAVGLVYRQLHKVETETSVASGVTGTSAGGPETEPSGGGLPPAPQAKEGFAKQVQKEAESISQLQADPDEVQERLKDLASQMQEADIVSLKESALNTALNGDERFLSIHLLGESSFAKAQESLETIAATPIPAQEDARFTNQEEILRVKAVESLREAESLKRVLAQTENSFITDHAQRNLLYREGKVSEPPEQQDLEALNRLLKKSLR